MMHRHALAAKATPKNTYASRDEPVGSGSDAGHRDGSGGGGGSGGDGGCGGGGGGGGGGVGGGGGGARDMPCKGCG